jgi:hypothetical protein
VVLEMEDKVNMDRVLGSQTISGLNCLHLAIKYRSPCTAMMIECASSYRKFISQKDTICKDLPLHLAVVAEFDDPGDTSDIAEDMENADQKSGNYLLQRKSPIIFSPYQVTRLLLKYNVEGLVSHNNFMETPYQKRLNILHRRMENAFSTHQEDRQNIPNSNIQNSLQEVVQKDRMASYIKSVCIRNFDDDRAIAALYKPGKGNLMRHPSVI